MTAVAASLVPKTPKRKHRLVTVKMLSSRKPWFMHESTVSVKRRRLSLNGRKEAWWVFADKDGKETGCTLDAEVERITLKGKLARHRKVILDLAHVRGILWEWPCGHTVSYKISPATEVPKKCPTCTRMGLDAPHLAGAAEMTAFVAVLGRVLGIKGVKGRLRLECADWNDH